MGVTENNLFKVQQVFFIPETKVRHDGKHANSVLLTVERKTRRLDIFIDAYWSSFYLAISPCDDVVVGWHACSSS